MWSVRGARQPHNRDASLIFAPDGFNVSLAGAVALLDPRKLVQALPTMEDRENLDRLRPNAIDQPIRRLDQFAEIVPLEECIPMPRRMLAVGDRHGWLVGDPPRHVKLGGLAPEGRVETAELLGDL